MVIKDYSYILYNIFTFLLVYHIGYGTINVRTVFRFVSGYNRECDGRVEAKKDIHE